MEPFESAVRDLGETPENLSAYSLSDPAITIQITRDDGTEITVSIGGTASDGNVYVMTSESNHIYTCDSYLATAFTCQLSDFEAIAEDIFLLTIVSSIFPPDTYA